MGSRRYNALLIALLALVATASGASSVFGETRTVQLSVDIGWGNHYRPGRWNPLFVTATSEQPREVTLEVYSPTDQRYAMKVDQSFAAGPTPRTLPLYIPLINSMDTSSVTLRDANTGRTLDTFTLDDPSAPLRQRPEMVNWGQLMIGASGNEGTERLLESQFTQANIVVGNLPLEYLPSVSAGYDALDLLVLNGPNLNRLDVDQQNAIVQWVRAGGTLVYWPGNDPLPNSGPLLDVLPCKLGATRTYEVPAKTLSSLGLPRRFAKLTGRAVSAVADDAATEHVFGQSELVSYRGWAGFGQIVVIPADVSMLTFNDSRKARAFWNAALKDSAHLPDENTNVGYNPWDGDPRQMRATQQALDWIGAVPGAGAFGFSYLAFALIAMMFVVGPVDWFVLKWMGRQPWTWVTTTGWIALVTFGAISVGHVLKSGDLHFRTVTLLDEEGGTRAAQTILAGIYSPRTREYDLTVDPQGWWRPAGNSGFYRRSGLQIDIPCHQDYRGNRPLPMVVNVWNLRFLQETNLTPASGIIAATLTHHGDQIEGSITNKAAFTLTNVAIRTSDGPLRVAQPIKPGETITVSGSINRVDQSFTRKLSKEPGYEQALPSTRPSLPTGGDLSIARGYRIDEMLEARNNIACVYAEFDAAPADVKLDEPDLHQLHTGMVRAIVPLK